jgi:hypothetical protein
MPQDRIEVRDLEKREPAIGFPKEAKLAPGPIVVLPARRAIVNGPNEAEMVSVRLRKY